MGRVPATEYHPMARALDLGIIGLMIPMMESAEQARRVVGATRYPLRGCRGAGLGMGQDDQEPGSLTDKIAALDDRTCIIAQIESPVGLESPEEIGAVDGIDCLWIGHNDLAIQMGISGQFKSQASQDAMARVAEVAAAHGTPCEVAAGRLDMALIGGPEFRSAWPADRRPIADDGVRRRGTAPGAARHGRVVSGGHRRRAAHGARHGHVAGQFTGRYTPRAGSPRRGRSR